MEAYSTLKGNNKGTTLAEMIVTFALIGIFLASAATVISSAVIMHSELTATMQAQNIGEMLLEKITGELAAAANEGIGTIVIEEPDESEESIGNSISFFDRNGRAAKIFAADGFLTFRYEKLIKQMEDGQNKVFEAQETGFDDKAYAGYRVTNLQFTKPGDSEVIKVKLQIKNLKTGFVYAATKTVKCYNFP